MEHVEHLLSKYKKPLCPSLPSKLSQKNLFQLFLVFFYVYIYICIYTHIYIHTLYTFYTYIYPVYLSLHIYWKQHKNTSEFCTSVFYMQISLQSLPAIVNMEKFVNCNFKFLATLHISLVRNLLYLNKNKEILNWLFFFFFWT